MTTDHISPAGSIRPTSPAGLCLQDQGVAVGEFNSYGARRGNHEVMTRGTFANTRIRNRLVPGTEGGVTAHLPDGEQMTDLRCRRSLPVRGNPARRHGREGIRIGLFSGLGGQRPGLLGVRASPRESFERIHRSNLIGMGVLPLQFRAGESAESLGLSGLESLEVSGAFGPRPRARGARAHLGGGRPFDPGDPAGRHAR